MSKRILMVVTNVKQIDQDHPTGLWLSEYAEPYAAFKKAGFQVEVASPLGGKIPLDPNSMTDERPSEWNEAMQYLDKTEKLSAVVFEGYDGIFLPGGHGPMFDLADDKDLQNILAYYEKENKAIGAVCHGPAAFANAFLPDGNPLVKGKKLTGFTNKEEDETGLAPLLPFLLQTKLSELGAGFVEAAPYSDHVVTDGHLVTGQNPQSSESTAQAFIKVVNK
ncbi:putative intracellular protease/amidase [Bacillus ectoiniformans]|uniref:type 1 glutamine amidotransferase domain-containing protein n=1 Tax=Bacillus ectoiniformans TaxID=1494429 RepID=UPI0019579B34|nr:type 1 glutamine amidotransferase domain-containing protein [Bacillus ectoiniformans]MBM7649238.1 putative intracellular protease/amidase [Bacillus ectoiniformans]